MMKRQMKLTLLKNCTYATADPHVFGTAGHIKLVTAGVEEVCCCLLLKAFDQNQGAFWKTSTPKILARCS